jgi:hypothetical protein
MFIRITLIASLLGYASTACANSCSNVDVIGTSSGGSAST